MHAYRLQRATVTSRPAAATWTQRLSAARTAAARRSHPEPYRVARVGMCRASAQRRVPAPSPDRPWVVERSIIFARAPHVRIRRRQVQSVALANLGGGEPRSRTGPTRAERRGYRLLACVCDQPPLPYAS